MVHLGLPSISKFFPICLPSGPPRGGGQQRGFLISSRSHFSSRGPSGWDGVWMIAPFCSTPLSHHFIPSPVRAGSPHVACAPTIPASSPLTIGQKMTNHSTHPTSQRSCSDWGHPASYSFTGDPVAFPGLFAFLVGGNRALVCLLPNLRSPAAVHHRALCPYSPQIVQLGPRDLGSPPQLVGQS